MAGNRRGGAGICSSLMALRRDYARNHWFAAERRLGCGRNYWFLAMGSLGGARNHWFLTVESLGGANIY